MSLRTRLLVVAAAAALASLAACAAPHARTSGNAAPGPTVTTAPPSAMASTPSVSTVGVAVPSSYRFVGGNTAVMYRPDGHTSVVDLNRFDRDGNLGETATISPDGSKIAYVDGATGTLALANLDGTDKVTTKIMLAQCGAPVWSPDSRRVLFVENSSHNTIETVNADGSGRMVIDAGGGCWPIFSVDGSRIAFVDRLTSALALTDPVARGGHRTVVATTRKIRTVMSISADGHAIVDVRPTGGCGCDDGLRHWSLQSPNVLDLTTGKLTPLTNAIGRVDSAYYMSGGGMVQMIYGRQGEPPARLVVMGPDGQIATSYANPIGKITKYFLAFAGI